jgi:hypothetical protein
MKRIALDRGETFAFLALLAAHRLVHVDVDELTWPNGPLLVLLNV